jgi:hypothetical protein
LFRVTLNVCYLEICCSLVLKMCVVFGKVYVYRPECFRPPPTPCDFIIQDASSASEVVKSLEFKGPKDSLLWSQKPFVGLYDDTVELHPQHNTQSKYYEVNSFPSFTPKPRKCFLPCPAHLFLLDGIPQQCQVNSAATFVSLNNVVVTLHFLTPKCIQQHFVLKHFVSTFTHFNGTEFLGLTNISTKIKIDIFGKWITAFNTF